MNEPKKPVLRLVPAKPPSSEDTSARYLPRLPWRYLLLGAGVLLAVIVGYTWKESRRAAELRTVIRRIHGTELLKERTAFMAFRGELERLITWASKAEMQTSIEPDFQLQDLRSGRGLYLRIPVENAGDLATIAQGAKAMEPDWIPSCMGLSPTSARELYEIGEFLTPGFVSNLSQKNVMQLRVQEDTLTRRRSTDLASLMAATHSDWFMLVLQEGKNRRDDPVRVFLWDLKRDVLLLRARVRSQGILLTTHILSQGTEQNSGKPDGDTDKSSPAVNDCSIASSLKKLASEREAASDEN